MFRKLKLKNTLICEFSILIPSLLAIIAGILCVAFIPNEEVSGFALIGCLTLALIFIMPKFMHILSLDFTLTSLRNWQKDRLSFFTDINGSSYNEVENAISARLSNWGAKKPNQNGAVLNRYKKIKTLNGIDKIVHQNIMVFSAPTLTFEDYKKTLDFAKKYAEDFIKDKKEEVSAIGVIFLADRTEQAVLNKVREDYIVEEKYIVLPLVYDGTSRQYYFDALYDYNMFGKSTKNYILDSYIRTVFNGKLPLENNDRFDYSNEISKWQDKTLGELIEHIKEEVKKDKNFLKDTAEQLSDGQVLYKDETLYIKHKGAVAAFLIFPDEEAPEKINVWAADIWEYPKQTEISKKDLKILKQIATDYFASQNKQVIFDPEENSEE